MAKPVGKRDLRKHLGALTREQLIHHLITLNDSFKEVSDYLQNVADPASDEEIRERYRKIIRNEFFPARGGFGKLRISIVRNAIANYGKVAASVDGPIDLMLRYVEDGVEFVNTYGDIDEPFYGSMQRMYAGALESIAKHGLEATFQPRCEQLVMDSHDFGYGFHDDLYGMYEDAFGEVDYDDLILRARRAQHERYR